jgi:hypothetical protein
MTDVHAEYLRAAKPRLICRGDVHGADVHGAKVKLTHFISQADVGWVRFYPRAMTHTARWVVPSIGESSNGATKLSIAARFRLSAI